MIAILMLAGLAAWQRVRMNQQLAAVATLESAGVGMVGFDTAIVPPSLSTVFMDSNEKPSPTIGDKWLNIPVQGVFVKADQCDDEVIQALKRLPTLRTIILSGWAKSELVSRLKQEFPNVDVVPPSFGVF